VTPILTVFLCGLATAAATGLGALPFAFLGQITPRAVGWSNAFAGGLMLGASFGLITEGTHHGAVETIVGAGLGVLFVLGGHGLLGNAEIRFGEIRGQGARQVLLVLVVMTVHSFAEGVAVGVSFGGGEKLAMLITIAIAVHNVPEGLAISAVMRPRGASVAACAAWSVFSSLPQPLMAVPAFVSVDAFSGVLPYGFGFAAGAMVCLVFLELLPEAYQSVSRSSVGLLVSLSLALMILFQRYL
jgi:zinc transporter ZupT